MNRQRTMVLLGAVMLSLTACTHTATYVSPPPTVDVSPIATPGDPINILREAGCTIKSPWDVPHQAFSTVPSFYSICSWGSYALSGWQDLEVWMYASNADRDADSSPVTRGHTVIIGDKFSAVLSDACCGEVNQVTADQVATRIHGTVVNSP